MELKELKDVKQLRTIGYICNCCGNRIDNIKQPFQTPEFATLHAEWGYNSRNDGEYHLSHLCQDCYEKVIVQFKVPPTIDYY
jgi:hypothetical protein